MRHSLIKAQLLAGDSSDALNEAALPAFRVTCWRRGSHCKSDKHSFASMDAARHWGGQLHERLQWHVSMKEYDVELVLNIVDKEVSFASNIPILNCHEPRL